MALIICKECGKQVSSKAHACPHCGCPVSSGQDKTLTYKGKTFDVYDIVSELQSGLIDEAYCDIVENICMELEPYDPGDADVVKALICSKFNIGQQSNQQATKPKCPTCGSTNIEKISAIARGMSLGMFGLASKTARSQFMCKNCGYKW